MVMMVASCKHQSNDCTSSIKIKIKPLTKPEESLEKCGERQGQDDTNHVRERSLSPVTNMHPKKKLAHMDSLVNNFPVVNNLIHSTLPFLQPLPMLPCDPRDI